MTMTLAVRAGTQGRSRFLVAVVFFVFFVISFLTNILGPLVPDIITDFHVSLTMAADAAVRVFHCLRRVVDSGGLCGAALGRKDAHGRLLRCGDLGRGQLRGLAHLFHGRDFAVCDRGGDGGTAGCHQSPVACGRRGGALCIQLRIRAAHFRRRILRESSGVFRSGEAFGARTPRS